MTQTRYEQLKEERLELVEAMHEGLDDGQADALSDAISSLEEDLKPYEHTFRAITALRKQYSSLESQLQRREDRGDYVEEAEWTNLEEIDDSINYYYSQLYSD